MKKDRAIELLGGTPKKAAEAMGYRAVQTIYLWPDVLPQATADRVMGVVGRMPKPGKRRRRVQPTSQEQGHA
ncbi:MAG: hypothetical protein PBV86_13665 [Delftia lacustris]|uniref:hypothetical protein n=1 Tax=Delftia TaxID=80865 RepID=UPI0012A93079|nr:MULTISPECIES: hypothetical protein [Delftia]QFS65881.1 hypothetical protein GCS91_16910 [Delftia tsuruhatensis]WON87466.1 hypothetical protein OK021_22340 [Delftia sp. UGAL515B_04]